MTIRRFPWANESWFLQYCFPVPSLSQLCDFPSLKASGKLCWGRWLFAILHPSHSCFSSAHPAPPPCWGCLPPSPCSEVYKSIQEPPVEALNGRSIQPVMGGHGWAGRASGKPESAAMATVIALPEAPDIPAQISPSYSLLLSKAAACTRQRSRGEIEAQEWEVTPTRPASRSEARKGITFLQPIYATV